VKSDLGIIVTNPVIRRAVYGTYVILLVLAGAVQAALVSINVEQPPWLTAVLAALVYLGIPVAGLAAANSTISPKVAAIRPAPETPGLCNSPNCSDVEPHPSH